MNLDLLPQDCFALILSFSSPRDACRSSLVSLTIHSTADSDIVWEKFLPSDCKELLSRFDSPFAYSTTKELFLRLCYPRLIDAGKKIFYIDKWTSKKCYILSARELCIKWANNPLYWSWNPLLESRFGEVAELRTIWWLQIEANVNSKMLSPNTAYGAYLIVKFADRTYGLDSLPSEVSLEFNNFKSKKTIYLQSKESKKHYLKHGSIFNSRAIEGEEKEAFKAKNGWVEIELGEFYNDGEDGEVKMSLKDVKSEQLKGGLIIEGIELRPKVYS